MSELKVGQKLWFVPSHHGWEPKWLWVHKVGRKWATCKYTESGDTWRTERIHLGNMWADGNGHGSPGRAYLSKDEYDNAILRQKTWDRYIMKIKRSIPDHLTLQDIAELWRITFHEDIPKEGA